MSIHWKTAASIAFGCTCIGFVLGVTGKSLIYLAAVALLLGGGGWAWQKLKSRKSDA